MILEMTDFPRSRITCQEEMNQKRTCFDMYGYNNKKYPMIPIQDNVFRKIHSYIGKTRFDYPSMITLS